jgi:hypothetical protein
LCDMRNPQKPIYEMDVCPTNSATMDLSSQRLKLGPELKNKEQPKSDHGQSGARNLCYKQR